MKTSLFDVTKTSFDFAVCFVRLLVHVKMPQLKKKKIEMKPKGGKRQVGNRNAYLKR